MQNAECRMQNAESRLQNPESRIQNPESRIQNSETTAKPAAETTKPADHPGIGDAPSSFTGQICIENIKNSARADFRFRRRFRRRFLSIRNSLEFCQQAESRIQNPALSSEQNSDCAKFSEICRGPEEICGQISESRIQISNAAAGVGRRETKRRNLPRRVENLKKEFYKQKKELKI